MKIETSEQAGTTQLREDIPFCECWSCSEDCVRQRRLCPPMAEALRVGGERSRLQKYSQGDSFVIPAKYISTALIIALIVTSLCACKEKEPQQPPPLFVRFTPTPLLQIVDSIGIYAVVEIPAGTTELQAIDTGGHLLSISDHPVDFLPFPGNYGFIAGCGKMDSVLGKLIPLPVLVMMPSLQAQSIVGISPVATLVLSRDGASYPIVIAIPADSTLQSIQAYNFVDFITEYDASRHILQQWFLNYQGREMFGFTGWRDEHYARQLIADWKLKE